MEPDRDALSPIFRDFGAVVAYLFGSRATGTSRETSDLDIAVLLDRPMTLAEREMLADRLAEATGIVDVDVVVLDQAPLELKGHVVQEGRAIYCSNEARRVAFESRTRSEYFDFLPALRLLTASYLKRVAEKGL